MSQFDISQFETMLVIRECDTAAPPPTHHHHPFVRIRRLTMVKSQRVLVTTNIIYQTHCGYIITSGSDAIPLNSCQFLAFRNINSSAARGACSDDQTPRQGVIKYKFPGGHFTDLFTLVRHSGRQNGYLLMSKEHFSSKMVTC